jgi:hypothetical protein
MAGGQATGYLLQPWRPMARNNRKNGMVIGKRFWPTAALALALFGGCAAVPAQAQNFPARPVHVIVPFAPGGGVDIVARLIAPKLSEAWGQPVVIENKPGAVGAVASEYVMHQPADGHTVLIGVAGSHAIAQYLNPNLGYDPVRDFAGVTVLSYSPLICLVAPASPFHTMKELVEHAKTTIVPFGSPGVGSQMHLIGEMFNLNYGTKFQHVAYRGVAPAMPGSARRAYSDGDGRNGLGEAAGHVGPVASAGGNRHETKHKRTRRADIYPGGFSELRGQQLVCFVRAGRHAESNRRQDRCRCDQGRPHTRDQRAARRRWLGARRRHAGGIHDTVA